MTSRAHRPVPPAYGPYAVMVRDAEGTITVPWRGNYKAAAYRQAHKYAPAKTGNYRQFAMVVPPGMSEVQAAANLTEIALDYQAKHAVAVVPDPDDMSAWRMVVVTNGRVMHVTSVTADNRWLWTQFPREAFSRCEVWEEGPTAAFLLASNDERRERTWAS